MGVFLKSINGKESVQRFEFQYISVRVGSSDDFGGVSSPAPTLPVSAGRGHWEKEIMGKRTASFHVARHRNYSDDFSRRAKLN